MSNQEFLQPQMTEAAIHFGKNLVASEPYVRYQKAEQALNSDAAALGLLNNLKQAQVKVSRAQTNGTIAVENLQALGELQRQVEAMPVITEYIASQQEMIRFFQEINTEISQLLGINFALIARRSSCC
jgi:cell fate (sporulation/competence/biofilm development) regulator YlbF (YheA/YmcA/DUF963 family)